MNKALYALTQVVWEKLSFLQEASKAIDVHASQIGEVQEIGILQDVLIDEGMGYLALMIEENCLVIEKRDEATFGYRRLGELFILFSLEKPQ